MHNKNKKRKELQKFIITLINNIKDENQKRQLGFIFYTDEKTQNWGSLSRGSLLLLLTNEKEGQLLLARAIEILHHASLIIDDQIDKAYRRRGKSTFWVKYGSENCILFSHMMVIMALNDLVVFDQIYNKNNKALMFALKTMKNMADAESEATKKNINSLDIYLNRACRKTGDLYKLVGELAGLISKKNILDINYYLSGLQMVGVAHQMLDDFIDSDSTKKQDCIFMSPQAKKENINRSIYKLLEYGYTIRQLKEIHKQYSFKAIKQLEQSLYDFTKKRDIISLCEQICFGPYLEQNNKLLGKLKAL